MSVRLHWGTGIALAYIAFALATVGVVVFAMGRPVALVRADYYAESLREDSHLSALANAAALGARVSIVATDEQVLVSLPAEQAAAAHGTITLYRASEAAADRVLDLAVDPAGRQRVPLSGLLAGRWLLQLRWSAGGRDFYLERPVVVRGGIR